VRIAEYYGKKRGVPPSQVLHIRAPVGEEIDRATYQLLIETPVATWLGRNAAQDQILYIVLTKDVPLRVAGTGGLDGTVASVDSELALLYRKMLGQPVSIAGHIPNPYFAQARTPPAAAERFTHRRADIYLVTRLDAFTEGEVIRLIDGAATPAVSGTIVLDQRGTGNVVGDRWLEQASEALAAAHRHGQVLLERTTTVVKNEPNVLGYYSWGSNDPAFRDRRLNLGFVPGSIAATFVSSDGRTFHEPPGDWILGSWQKRASFYAGSPQSLAGDLLREGATAVAAHVAEPFLDGTIRPQVLFPAYMSGLNVAEAFYAAMPYLSWQTVVVGDPLCAPFRQGALPREEIDRGLAPDTELPGFFSARRLETASRRLGGDGSQTASLIRAESRLSRGDSAGARAALEQVLQRDPKSAVASRALAELDRADGRYERAAERYQRILKDTPGDVIALNNLAYLFADRLNKLADALPLAERAFARAPSDVNIVDTLAWIHHLRGDNGRAAALLDPVLRTQSPTAEVLVHAAAVSIALGNIEMAERQLGLALDAVPELVRGDDVPRVQAAIARSKAKKP
jgi:uncharacterized protein (TIGR03790 family)